MNGSVLYQIQIRGHLSDHWENWFEGATLEPLQAGETLLAVRVPDQAALFGILNRIRDAGLTLISVLRMENL